MRQQRAERGNAIIEFALAFTVMVPLFPGAFQFGFAFLPYQCLEVLAHNGVRTGAMLPSRRPSRIPCFRQADHPPAGRYRQDGDPEPRALRSGIRRHG